MKTLISLVALFVASLLSFFFVSFYISLTLFSLVLLAMVIFLPVFTVVKEGTAKIRIRLESFDGVMLTKKGHVISSNGDIISGRDPRFLAFLGGVHFVGIRGIHSIHKRSFEWIKALTNGGTELRKEVIDFILAMVDYQYAFFVDKAEDKDFLPLDVTVVMTARVRNPHKAIFNVQNWFEAVSSRIVPQIREFIKKGSYIQEGKDCLPAEELLRELQDFIQEVDERYGIEILKLEVSKVDPPESFRKATLSKFTGERQAEEVTASLGGLIIGMLSSQTGIPVADLRDEFKTDPEVASAKYEPILSKIRPLINRKLIMDGGGKVYDFGTESGGGGFGLAAVVSELFGGGKDPSARGGKKKAKDMTDDEKDEEIGRILG